MVGPSALMRLRLPADHLRLSALSLARLFRLAAKVRLALHKVHEHGGKQQYSKILDWHLSGLSLPITMKSGGLATH